MKIKTIVALAIVAAVLLAGSIILFGLMTSALFPIIYFMFISIVLITIVVSLRNKYPKKSDLVFMIAAAIIFSVTLSFFAGALKEYHTISTTISKDKQALSDEIDYLTQKNDYYFNYISHINSQIMQSQESSSALQAQIDEINSRASALNTQTITTQEAPPIIYRDDDFYKREEEYND